LFQAGVELRPAILAVERLDPWPTGLWQLALVKCDTEPLLQQTTRNDSPTQPKSFTRTMHKSKIENPHRKSTPKILQYIQLYGCYASCYSMVFGLAMSVCTSVRMNAAISETTKNQEERYSRVPRLSDTRYSAYGSKGKWRYASSKARLKCATYPWYQYVVMVDRFKRYPR